MDNLDYAQSVVLARVYEKRLLGKAKLDRMIEASDANESFKILMDSEYSKSANNVFDVYGYVELLNQELVRVRNLAQELLNDENLLELMMLRYEYHNLKVIAKSKYTDKDLSEKFISSKLSNPNLIFAQVQAGKYTNIKNEYAKALKDAFAEYEKTKDPQITDIIIDKHYFNHLYELALKINREYFYSYVKAEIDFYNIISLLRMQKMGKTSVFADKVFADNGNISKNKLLSLLQADIDKIISALRVEYIGGFVKQGLEEYKKTGNLFNLEQQKKKFLFELNKDARFIAFGPEPVISYLLTKEYEIDKVRFILIAKLNNISADIIKERLGD